MTWGALALAVTVATACGRDPGAVAVTHTITIEGVSYAPPSVTVNAGDRIIWVNKDPYPHTATSPAAALDSREIAGDGGSFTFTAAQRGDFTYVCTLHPTMTGVLHVK